VRPFRRVLIFSIFVFTIAAVAAARASERDAVPARGITAWFKALYAEATLKFDRAANLDRDNEALRQRTAELELANARLQSDSFDCLEKKRADQLKEEAKHEGGVEISRTIASLRLSDEDLLARPPKIVFEAASHAVERGDFETAAKGFKYLADSEENETYQTPQTYFLAGYSLFRLRNYKLALKYLGESARRARGDDLAYAPRALAWVALCHAKLGNKAASQKAARELLQRFPKSSEARRLNRNA
jgi:TolA-binding protein